MKIYFTGNYNQYMMGDQFSVTTITDDVVGFIGKSGGETFITRSLEGVKFQLIQPAPDMDMAEGYQAGAIPEGF